MMNTILNISEDVVETSRVYQNQVSVAKFIVVGITGYTVTGNTGKHITISEISDFLWILEHLVLYYLLKVP